jgi:hypothetical protein
MLASEKRSSLFHKKVLKYWSVTVASAITGTKGKPECLIGQELDY